MLRNVQRFHWGGLLCLVLGRGPPTPHSLPCPLHRTLYNGEGADSKVIHHSFTSIWQTFLFRDTAQLIMDTRDEKTGYEALADISFIKEANDAASVRTLSSEIGTLGAAWLGHEDDSRLELLKKARALVQALETPRETMIKHLWAQVVAS